MPSASFPIDAEAGKRFKVVRQFLRLGQQEMADLCKISQPLLNKVEKGTREIPVHTLKILHLKKNINPNYIILGEKERMEY